MQKVTDDFHTITSILKPEDVYGMWIIYANNFHTITSILKQVFWDFEFHVFTPFPYDYVYFKAACARAATTLAPSISIRLRLF